MKPLEPYEVLGEGQTVIIAGDKPGFIEELKEGLTEIAQLFVRLVTFWREHAGTKAEGADLFVSVKIHNHGPNDIRVILGNNANDSVLVAGNTGEYTAAEYIEVRELGV